MHAHAGGDSTSVREVIFKGCCPQVRVNRVTAPDGKAKVVLASSLKRGESHLVLTVSVGGKDTSSDVWT